ncbi:MAG TPA: AraC family transcriptional regulator [Terriglobales bacterium]
MLHRASSISRRRLYFAGPKMKLNNSWQRPLLDDFLRRIRLRSCVSFRSEFRSPWGISIARSRAIFHIVQRGNCWLQIGDLAPPTQLSEGDIAVFPRGDAHTLRNQASTPTVDFFNLVNTAASGETQRVFGGNGTATRLLCVGARFESGVSNPLAAMLPPVLLMKRSEQSSTATLALAAQQILTEMDHGEAAAGEAVTRVLDILFIKAVGAYFDQNAETAESGWLAAFRDERIGRALSNLHENPEKPWTVDSLARTAALSRSAFAARFKEFLGEPPLHYLARIRINTAAIRLLSTDESLKSIATIAGYESVAAFVKSFKRIMGVTPGEYRHLQAIEAEWGWPYAQSPQKSANEMVRLLNQARVR